MGERGFALLITVTLVAFLVLIVISLATLTRVETRVAANSQQHDQARQNALMALNIALGELQKYTGPDQRTTARSDMDVALAATTTASGRWLGAYGNGAPADYTQAPSALASIITGGSDTRGRRARLLNWLVSGNEETAFDPASHVGVNGEITTPPSTFRFKPDGTVSGLSASINALSDTLTVADSSANAHPARLLVGPGTVGDSVEDYVVAPVRDIRASLPGIAASSPTVGRYAWWVGDQGAKARVNLSMATEAQAANAFASAQRAAIELVDAVNPTISTSLATASMLDPTGAKALYDPAGETIPRLISVRQLPMLSQATPLATYRYHDLGTHAATVLADPEVGGLKRDLSAILADTGPGSHPSPEADTDFVFPPEQTYGSTPEIGVTTWGLLRSHVQTTADSGGLAPEPPSMTKVSGHNAPLPTSAGVGPVLTYAYVGFSYGVPQNIAPPWDTEGNPVKLAIYPIVVLWNPYTQALKPARYEVGFRKNTMGQFELQAKNPDDTGAWNADDILHLGNLDNFSGSNDKFIRFVIDNADGIPAGQSLVFTLGLNGADYAPADEANPLVNAYHPGYHVLLDTGVTIGMPLPQKGATATLLPEATYRVGVKGASHNTDQAKIANTFFSSARANFGGNDTHEIYLGDIGSTPPGSTNTNYPYTTSFASRRWYQSVTRLLPPYNSAPYGTGIDGFSSEKAANGLFRPEGPITVLTEPTFRLGFFMGFKEGRDRWLAQGNPRALMAMSGNFIRTPADSGTWPTSLFVIGTSKPRATAGMNLKHSSTAPIDARLFEFRSADQPLLGIGQLQHANVSWLNATPSYAIGNSLLPAAYDTHHDALSYATGTASTATPANLVSASYDISWLLNHALWDRYFVSTVPHKGTGASTGTVPPSIPDLLPNPRMRRLPGASDTSLRDATQAAAVLMLAGGFNINSTSEQAWRAVLGGVNRLNFDPVAQSATAQRQAALSRFSRPSDPAAATIDASTAWSGYRELTGEQIARLARNIVDEIRRRGPFVSLSDFINRRLVDDGDFPLENDQRLKGTIQAAIDATTTGPQAANNENTAPFDAATTPLVTDSYATTKISSAARTGAAAEGTGVRVAPFSSPSAFAPQFLTQGDVLSAVGAGLAGRSDTFTIRAYGEHVSAATGETTGRAWCEAVVQRLPEYVDANADPTPHTPPTSSTNIRVGRRYVITSFSWLNADDI